MPFRAFIDVLLPLSFRRKVLHEIYFSIPGLACLFKTIRKFWRPPYDIYRWLRFRGIIEVTANSKKFLMNYQGEYIETCLFWEGLASPWERKSLQLWTELCLRSNTILDIGANTGIYALIAKTLRPDATVAAFEPILRNWEKLQANCHLNHFDIQTFNEALSNEVGIAKIYDPGGHVYAVTINRNLNPPHRAVTETLVPTITLQYFIENKGFPKIDLIKLDVETHEPEVLNGFGRYLKEMKPTFLIEVLNASIGKRLEEYFTPLNYLFFSIDEKNGSVLQASSLQSDQRGKNYLISCNASLLDSLGLVKNS